MNKFIIHLGKQTFHIEPLSTSNQGDSTGQFKIYENDNVFTLNEGNIDYMPPHHLLGTLTIRDKKNPKNFDFSGSGRISGKELIQLTELIIEHVDKEC